MTPLPLHVACWPARLGVGERCVIVSSCFSIQVSGGEMKGKKGCRRVGCEGEENSCSPCKNKVVGG